MRFFNGFSFIYLCIIIKGRYCGNWTPFICRYVIGKHIALCDIVKDIIRLHLGPFEINVFIFTSNPFWGTLGNLFWGILEKCFGLSKQFTYVYRSIRMETEYSFVFKYSTVLCHEFSLKWLGKICEYRKIL